MTGNSATVEAEALNRVLEVTRKLAAPFDLDTMLTEVVDAARNILNADRGSVFLYDPASDELVVRVATELGSFRIPADKGIVGECAKTRTLINVPDCYADPRFNRDIDKRTGYRTRCMLTLPLIGYEDSLIGVLQILNRKDGTFDEQDEFVAAALAAQAAVVLHRVKLTEAMIASEKLDREITVARDVQMGTLPKTMPSVRGYDIGGTFTPTDQTGGDLYDFIPVSDERLFLLMGDATGHGIGPALSATQVRAMLRVALRLGADLSDAFTHINDQLVEDLPDDRFVTAFFGLLDSSTHQVHFHSGGQGPIMHYHAADQSYDWYEPSTFPLGYMNQTDLDDACVIDMQPGDILGLISDGIYEYENHDGEQFGFEGVRNIVDHANHDSMESLVQIVMNAAYAHGGSVPQADDITIVLIRRAPAEVPNERSFARSYESLEGIFEFTEGELKRAGIAKTDRQPVHLAIEEIFTNMVRHDEGTDGDILLSLRCGDDAVTATLTDADSDEFDVTAAPEVDTSLSLDDRPVGGLGLHLVRKMVDTLEYDYRDRQSTISFTRRFERRDV